MRKTWIAIVATVVLGVTIYGGYHAYGAYEQSKQLESDLFLANVEALSQNETSPSDTGPGDTFKCKRCGVTVKICDVCCGVYWLWQRRDEREHGQVSKGPGGNEQRFCGVCSWNVGCEGI